MAMAGTIADVKTALASVRGSFITLFNAEEANQHQLDIPRKLLGMKTDDIA